MFKKIFFKNQPAKQSKDHEQQAFEREQNRKRNFNHRQADTVHTFSVGIISCTTVLTLTYCYFYWKSGLMELMLSNLIFCIIAECTVGCWGIIWWVQLAPKLLAAKNPLKNHKFPMLAMLLAAPFFALAIYVDTTNGALPAFCFWLIFINFGGRVIFELGFTWYGYYRSAEYKEISFIEYCNEIKE